MKAIAPLLLVVLTACDCSMSHELDGGSDGGRDAGVDGADATEPLDAQVDSDASSPDADADADTGTPPTCSEEEIEFGWIRADEFPLSQDVSDFLVIGDEAVVTGGDFRMGPDILAYSIDSGEWRVVAEGRARNEAASTIEGNRILLTGGGGRRGRETIDGFSTDRAEVYEDGAVTTVTNMGLSRGNHESVTLDDGQVLVAGGWSWASRREPSEVTGTCELYNVESDAWRFVASLNDPRWSHSLTMLSDGRVLAIGGLQGQDESVVHLDSAEVYDPATDRWERTGSMSTGRAYHEALLLPSGRVLVVGGQRARTETLASAEIWDPATGEFSPTASLPLSAEDMASVTLPDGRIVVAGGVHFEDDGDGYGLATVHLFDERADCWQSMSSLSVPRGAFGMVLLPDGHLMAAGGLIADFELNRVTEISSHPIDLILAE